MKKAFNRFLSHYFLPQAGLILVKTISMTYRVRIISPENETKTLAQFKSLIYASWHQRFFPGITLFSKKRPIAIMISQSRDGEYIAKVAEALGHRPVRGSSSRGGSLALRELKRLVDKGYKVAHIVDGPRGPFGMVKPGLVSMAQATGVPIVPVVVSPQKAWVFNSWDRFMVPKPFSRIVIRYGEPIQVGRRLSRDEFERIRLKVEHKLQSLYEETDQLWTSQEKVKEIFSSSA